MAEAKAKALKEADEKAEAEARALVETSNDLRPINHSDPDPEFTFLNDSTFINESEMKNLTEICSESLVWFSSVQL